MELNKASFHFRTVHVQVIRYVWETACLVSKPFCKMVKITCHIEYCGTCLEH